MNHELTQEARQDLSGIWRYSRDNWGREQADKYIDNLIARFIWLGRNRSLWSARDDLRPGLYSYSEGSHMIIYREEKGELKIIRILHSRMDIGRHV